MPGPHRYQRPGLRSADALIDGLVGLGRRVITFDPPGSGRSTRPALLSMSEMHQCADEALGEAGVEGPVDAAGHSMGGLALLAYALARPARSRRLVLVGTGSGGPALKNAPGAIHRRGHPDFWRIAVLGSLQLAWPFRAPERLVLNLIERASFVDRRWLRPRPIAWRDWLRPREGRPDWSWIAPGDRGSVAPGLRESCERSGAAPGSARTPGW
jgi:pimeloyl-ACP methyl ester carboxylesterase